MSILLDLFHRGASHGESGGWTHRFFGGGASRKTTAGITVGEQSAMSLSAYFACIRVVAEDVGKMPLILYRRKGADRERATEHPVYSLLHDSPSPDYTPMSFWETMVSHAASWGNGYAEIQRGADGRPAAMWLIHPSRVEPKRVDGRLEYRVRIDDVDPLGRKVGRMLIIASEDMFHLHGMGGDGITGYSILRHASETLGLGLAQQNNAAAFFGNGAQQSLMISHPNSIGPEALQNLRESFAAAYTGPENSHKPLILEEDMKVERLTIPPNEAQFLESRQFQIEEICRWARVLPIKIGHNTNTPYTNVESLNQAHVIDCLSSWDTRIRQEVRRKLLMGRERAQYFAELEFKSLLRGDHTTRSAFYRTMIGIGAMTINESRRAENLPEVEGGDRPLVQGAMTTLDRVVNPPEPKPQPAFGGRPKQDEGGDRNEEGEPTEGGKDTSAMARELAHPVLADACGRILRKEASAMERAQKKHGKDTNALNAWGAAFINEQGHRQFIMETLVPGCVLWQNLGDREIVAFPQTTWLADHESEFFAHLTGTRSRTTTPESMADAILDALEQESA